MPDLDDHTFLEELARQLHADPTGRITGRTVADALGHTAEDAEPVVQRLKARGLLDWSPAPARTFDRQLRAASHRHDFCYQHGLGTFGRDRAACDSDFLADALRICRMSERDTPGAYAGVVLGHCMAHARLAYLAVTVGGAAALGGCMALGPLSARITLAAAVLGAFSWAARGWLMPAEELSRLRAWLAARRGGVDAAVDATAPAA